MIYDYLSQVLSLIPEETISGLEGAIDTSINKNVSGIEDSEKISSLGKKAKIKIFQHTIFFKNC